MSDPAVDPKSSRAAMELAWAAGLFEGEGSFTYESRTGIPNVRLSMADEDSVRRFSNAIGFGRVRGPKFDKRPNRKPLWEWTAGGFEKSQAILGMLWFGLGSRRRRRAIELLRAAPVTRPYARSVCRSGRHEMTPDNTMTDSGRRRCRECNRGYQARYYREHYKKGR